MKNKRGDIPVMILVLGVFAICALAILSFYISDIRFGKSSFGIELFETVHADVEKFNFYQSNGDLDSAKEIGEIINGYLVIERSNDVFSIKFEKRME